MNSFEEVFNCIIDYCRDVGEVGDVAIKLWIKTLQPISLEGNRAIFSVDSDCLLYTSPSPRD